MIYNGATWDRLRTPTTVKSASSATSSSVGIWTPAAGKKFRLMGYWLHVDSNVAAAASANANVFLSDGATTMGIVHGFFIPTTALTAEGAPALDTGFINLGNGILSAAADRVLNFTLSVSLTLGVARIFVCGTEE